MFPLYTKTFGGRDDCSAFFEVSDSARIRRKWRSKYFQRWSSNIWDTELGTALHRMTADYAAAQTKPVFLRAFLFFFCIFFAPMLVKHGCILLTSSIAVLTFNRSNFTKVDFSIYTLFERISKISLTFVIIFQLHSPNFFALLQLECLDVQRWMIFACHVRSSTLAGFLSLSFHRSHLFLSHAISRWTRRFQHSSPFPEHSRFPVLWSSNTAG